MLQTSTNSAARGRLVLARTSMSTCGSEAQRAIIDFARDGRRRRARARGYGTQTYGTSSPAEVRARRGASRAEHPTWAYRVWYTGNSRSTWALLQSHRDTAARVVLFVHPPCPRAAPRRPRPRAVTTDARIAEDRVASFVRSLR